MARSDGTSLRPEDSIMAQWAMKVFLYIVAWIQACTSRIPGASIYLKPLDLSEQPYYKALHYIWGWMENHKDRNCVDHATGSEQGRPALHFMNTELIHGRHYCLQLHKEPLTNVVKEFNVTWLSDLDIDIDDLSEHFFDVSNVVVDGVMYCVILETTTNFIGDGEYLVSLKLTRV